MQIRAQSLHNQVKKQHSNLSFQSLSRPSFPEVTVILTSKTTDGLFWKFNLTDSYGMNSFMSSFLKINILFVRFIPVAVCIGSLFLWILALFGFTAGCLYINPLKDSEFFSVWGCHGQNCYIHV